MKLKQLNLWLKYNEVKTVKSIDKIVEHVNCLYPTMILSCVIVLLKREHLVYLFCALCCEFKICLLT